MRRLMSFGSAVMVIVLGAGLLALAYARWTMPVAEAEARMEQGQFERALASYAVAEQRFERVPFTKQLFAAEYRGIVSNELWLLYRLGRFDDAIDKAERSGDSATSHFWAGCAFFDKARSEEKADARLALIGRAQEEFRRAIESNPRDLATKYDYELTTRLTSESRRQAKAPPKQLMQLLRPEPKKTDKPTKRVG